MCSTPYGLIKKTHDLGHGAKIKSGRSAVPLNGFTGESIVKKNGSLSAQRFRLKKGLKYAFVSQHLIIRALERNKL